MASVLKHLVALRPSKFVKAPLASANFVLTRWVSYEIVEGCPAFPVRAIPIGFAFNLDHGVISFAHTVMSQ